VHQSSTSTVALPNNVENLGSVQSVVWPQTASPSNTATTAAVGMALRSRCQNVPLDAGVGAAVAAGAGDAGKSEGEVVTSRRVVVDGDIVLTQ
jgi:hypothetical protein